MVIYFKKININTLLQLCKLVQREEFTNSLIELGLIEPSNMLQDDGMNCGWGTFKRFGVDYKNVKVCLILFKKTEI